MQVDLPDIARAHLPACMGGWCAKRDHCANYHAEHREQPAERLCEPGRDGAGMTQPVRLAHLGVLA